MNRDKTQKFHFIWIKGKKNIKIKLNNDHKLHKETYFMLAYGIIGPVTWTCFCNPVTVMECIVVATNHQIIDWTGESDLVGYNFYI